MWFQASFEALSQSKIKTLQKNNFTTEQFKELAKKNKNHYTKLILCVEWTNNKNLSFFHPQLFFPNPSLEQISSKELKIPPLVSQVAPVRETLGGSEIVVGIFKNRFRIILRLLQVISVGKWFICFQTVQHFLAF